MLVGRITYETAQPRIRGTAICVSLLLDMMGEGLTREQILAELPELTDADLSAVIAYRFLLSHPTLH